MDLQATLDRTFGAHIEAVCGRSAQALSACGYSGLLVYAGAPLPVFEDDRTYPFEANAPFKVWVPLPQAPGSFLWFEPGSTPRLIIERPEDYWHKPADLPEGYWVRSFDVHAVADRTKARALLPADLSRAAYIGDAFPELTAWGVGAVNPQPLMRRLDYVRAVKTPYELACLREASRLGARGHRAARAAFTAGASEFEIELAFLEACGLREQELPYNPIIALNAGAAVLHYQVLEKRAPPERFSLLIDAGAEFGGYASDITRTYSYQDADFAALIERMDRMQQSLCAGVRAGVDWRDVHLRAHQLTAEVLREADLIRCSVEEAVANGVTAVFLPHGIGHLLGLEVHDVGGLMRSPEGGEIPRPAGHPHLRLTRVLEAGFVVTMEPGIYFIGQLLSAARADGRGRHINWSRVEALAPFGGIRIEDDLAITPSGHENLTRAAFN
ncbi:MAG TPA: Xaa-Pro dipeptidase [Steroidobacteraceae bacterium]|jgi:Xaa-Pro dipeptidase|nr:Xaa-Pro dipeptidase [Steroidobacteraceae bacterium]